MAIDAAVTDSMFYGLRRTFPAIAQSAQIQGKWIDANVTRVAAGSIPTDYGIVEGKASTARIIKAHLATAGISTYRPKTGDLIPIRDTTGTVTDYRIGLVQDYTYHFNLTLSDKAAG